MPRGIYPRKKNGAGAPSRPRKARPQWQADLLQRLRDEKARAEDRVVALGTALDALENLEERPS